LTYTIQVTNTGPGPATGIVIRDILPTGLHYEAAIANQGVYSPTSQQWTVDSLAPHRTALLTLTVTVDATAAGQTIINTAQIVAVDQPDIVPGNDQASAGVAVNNPPATTDSRLYVPIIMK